MSKLDQLKNAVSKQTLKQQIALELANMIQSGSLQAGEQLPSARDMAKLLNVSRETVRGAVKVLNESGIVDLSQGARPRIQGGTVAQEVFTSTALRPERYDAADIFDVRFLLEVEAAKNAAMSISSAEKARLNEILSHQVETIKDPVQYSISDAEFHRTIFSACGNRYIVDILRNIYSESVRRDKRPQFTERDYLRSIEDHRMIVEALARGDSDGVSFAMAHHLRWVHQANYRGSGA